MKKKDSDDDEGGGAGGEDEEEDDDDDDDQTNGHGKRKRTDTKRRRKPKRKLSLREEIRRDLAINPIPTPVVDELVKMLQELENSPSSDADVKQSHFQN